MSRAFCTLAFLVVLALSACDGPSVEPAPQPAVQGRPVQTDEGVNEHTAGPWRYVLHVRAKGSRSETRAGLLFKDNDPVVGQKAGETILTPWGPMRWFGAPPSPIRIQSPYEFGWLHVGTYDRPLGARE